MIEYLKAMFRTPTAGVMAARELEEAKRERLKAQTYSDYYRNIIEYHNARIKRLTGYTDVL